MQAGKLTFSFLDDLMIIVRVEVIAKAMPDNLDNILDHFILDILPRLDHRLNDSPHTSITEVPCHLFDLIGFLLIVHTMDIMVKH